MATYFWVGGTGTWSNVATANWATSTGGAPGAGPPTSADAVIFDTNSITTNNNTITLNSGAACASLTVTGPAQTNTVFTINTNLTLSGNLAFNGNAAGNRLHWQSGTPGTARTVSVAGTVSVSNADLMDIAATGPATPWSGASLGDGQGNSGITFAASQTRYWVATSGGNWSSTASWSTLSGGASGASVPLPQDDAIIDANSITSASRTITVNVPRAARNVDFSRVTNSPILAMSGNIVFYGNFTGGALASTSGVSTATARGRGAQTFKSAGLTWTVPWSFQPCSGSYTLLDNFASSGTGAAGFQAATGTFNANGFNVTAPQMNWSGTAIVNMGSGVWTVSGANATVVAFTNNGATVNAGTSTILMTDTSATAKTFTGASKVYNNLIISSGTGAVTMTGGNTFATLYCSAPLVLPASTTTTCAQFAMVGISGVMISLTSSTSGTRSTLSVATGGRTTCEYVAMSDQAGAGGAGFIAGATCTNVSNNTVWSFTGTSSRFFVGSGTNYSSTASWSLTSGGASGASFPTAANDVFLDANSPGNLVVDVSVSSRNLDCTGFTHALTITGTLSASPTAGGNVFLGAGMTTGSGATLSVACAAGAFALVRTNGVTMNAFFQVSGSTTGGVTLLDPLTTSATATVTLAAGTLNTGSFNHSWGLFNSSNSTVRTFAPGNSTITITGAGTAWNTSTGTNLTITPNTATIIMTGSSVTFQASTTASFNWQGMSVTFAGSGTPVHSSGGIFGNITRLGTASKLDAFNFAGGNLMTINGVLTLTGNSLTNRLLVYYGNANTTPMSKTITVNGSVSLQNVDLLDITAGGTAPQPWTGTSLGDCGGNVGITFDTAILQSWNASVTGNWSDATKWTNRVPLPQDPVKIAILAAGATITVDMPRIGASLDFTGCTGGTVTLFVATPPGAGSGYGLYGDLTLNPAVSLSGSIALVLLGHGAQKITSHGTTLSWGIYIGSNGGSYTLQDPFAQSSSRTFQVGYGTFDTGNQPMLVWQFFSNFSNNIRTINLNGSTITVFGTGNAWNFGNPGPQTGLTFNAGTSTIVLSDTTTTSTSFLAGGANITYNNVTFAGGNKTIAGAITNINGFFTMQNGGTAPTLTLPVGFTVSAAPFVCVGTPATPIKIVSSTPGTQTTLSQTSGWAYVDWTQIQDSNATGGATFNAGPNSTNVSNNTGWTFGAGPGDARAGAAPGYVSTIAV